MISELRRIIAYQDNFRLRLDRALSEGITPGSTAASKREEIKFEINAALESLLAFETKFKAETEVPRQIILAQNFDEEFPLFRADRSIGQPQAPSARFIRPGRTDQSQPFGRDSWVLFLQREKINTSQVFQNSTLENREWLTRYEVVFNMIESQIPSLDRQVRLPSLDALPMNIASLSGARSLSTMTTAQIQIAIDKYRIALLKSLDEAESTGTFEIREFREKILKSADSIGTDLVSRSSEASLEFRSLEKGIASQARSLYGNKVGADSFNYLLIVFAVVFGLIMTLPRFYSDAVATNILKAEFLLQFSTVFVLIAAIIILGIGELIDKQQLPVLLAGISGYVLGQLGKV